MGTIRTPEPALLFAAVMWSCDEATDTIVGQLVDEFGRIAYECGPIVFSFTEYYSREMGRNLSKMYLVFAEPFAREHLPRVKCRTNEIEAQCSRDGNRRVNIDPGYLTRDKLALASTKDFFHRLYLGEGIYGEVTLHFRQGRWRHFSWTYRDYRLEEVQQMLTRARARLVGDIRRKERRSGS